MAAAMCADSAVDGAEADAKRRFGAGWAVVRNMTAGRTGRIRELAEEALRTLPAHCYGARSREKGGEREREGEALRTLPAHYYGALHRSSVCERK